MPGNDHSGHPPPNRCSTAAKSLSADDAAIRVHSAWRIRSCPRCLFQGLPKPRFAVESGRIADYAYSDRRTEMRAPSAHSHPSPSVAAAVAVRPPEIRVPPSSYASARRCRGGVVQLQRPVSNPWCQFLIGKPLATCSPLRGSDDFPWRHGRPGE
jgi:hypothetical protein